MYKCLQCVKYFGRCILFLATANYMVNLNIEGKKTYTPPTLAELTSQPESKSGRGVEWILSLQRRVRELGMPEKCHYHGNYCPANVHVQDCLCL